MKTKQLVASALMIAIGTLLSLITLISLPFGGTVTPASMVPIVLIAYLYGTKWGLFSAFVYALMQMITGMGTISAFFLPGDSQMAIPAAIMICVIDYILAFTALGFAGVFKGKMKNNIMALVCGVLLSCVLRFIMHTISGAIFFGSWAEWFFTDSTGLSQISFLKGFCESVMANYSGWSLSLVYSLVYNAAYMLPETIITALVAPVLYKAIEKVA